MTRLSLEFERPGELAATAPPEARGLERDGVRLLVTDAVGNVHRAFRDLPALLRPGDLLVVNESATLPASLPAIGPAGRFRLNLSTDYGGGVWLAEPRRDFGTPGPVEIVPGVPVRSGQVRFYPIAPYPGIERLWFFRVEGALADRLAAHGEPIRYGYVERSFPLPTYQTVFARVPGSAEMPSAGRPFTPRLLEALNERGIGVAPLVLHAGVSSLESEPGDASLPPMYPEPFDVPAATAERVNATHEAGGRVVAVGTTVIRALETAWEGCRVVPRRGFTQLVVRPGRPVRAVDGLITGLHDSRTSHLALLFGFADERRVREAYREAVRERYLWHEFGDSHLLWAA